MSEMTDYEKGVFSISSPAEPGYSKEAKTRFFAIQALVEAKNQMPALVQYNVVETVQ